MGKGSARKGLSYDEKKRLMLEYMMDKAEVFTLAELEKVLTKAKGIVRQSVKEILQALCDDDLVDFDKIGSGNFFWALPSKAMHARQTKKDQFESKLKELAEKETQLNAKKRKLSETRVASEDRAEKVNKLIELSAELARDEEKLALHSDCDPDRLKEIEEATTQCRYAANRWTDNVLEMLSYFKKKNSEVTDEKFFKHFQLPTDLDYI